MSTNAELAAIFNEMADILALTGASSFRVSAYQRAARVLGDLSTDVGDLADDPGTLTDIEGIGDSTAKKIVEYVETGKIAAHEKLKQDTPLGLLDLLRLPGVGPKTVKLMWDKAGVVDRATLVEKLDSGEIAELPRMGEKAVQNIRDALAFLEKSSGRVRLGQALPKAEAIVEQLRGVSGVKQIRYAGSLRRGRETIGDIDILVSTTDPEAVGEAFRDMVDVEKVLVAGDTKSSVRLDEGIQVDLRVVEDDAFGAALMYFTGSKEHNVVLRERAIKRNLRLNEYGLFPDDGTHDEPPQKRGVTPVACATEQDIYDALDLHFVPPELREDRGELSGVPDDLITIDDIVAELHSHTTASDGKLSIEDLAQEAKRRGRKVLAITDHSPSSVLANGLDEARLRTHIDAIRKAGEAIKGLTLLAGSEVDILVDGGLDYDDDVLAELDVVVASPHASLAQDRGRATKRLIAAIENPHVHILGHPTGRLINKREGLPLDIDAVIRAAVEHDVALEINANFMRLDLRDTHVRAAVDAGALIAINTDAHGPVDFDQLRYGVMTARRGWLPADRCINTWSVKKLRSWLDRS